MTTMILQLLLMLQALYVGYLLNHSFMMPGLVSVTVSTLVAFALTNLIY